VTVLSACCVNFLQDYAAAGQKHAYPTPDTMNAALEAFYGNEQGSAKRPRLN